MSLTTVSITKMSDTCTLSQLSPVSDCTLSVSPRWVIPVLYCVYMPLWHQLMNQKPLFSISENYSQHCQTTLSWSKYYSLVSIGVNRSVITVISITAITYVSDCTVSITKMNDTCTLSQLSLMSLTVLYQYHQDEWYLYSIQVITVIEYRYHSSWWYWQ
jgi:hypothetical protein